MTREERLEKKRAAERLRYQRIKNDPEKYAQLKAKEHMKYEKKKEKGKIKTVNQMTAEEKEQARKSWREKTKRQRLRRYAKLKFKWENKSASSDTSYLPINNHKPSLSCDHKDNSCDDHALLQNASPVMTIECPNYPPQNKALKDNSLNYLTTCASALDNTLRNNTSLWNETKQATLKFKSATTDISCIEKANETDVSKEVANCSK